MALCLPSPARSQQGAPAAAKESKTLKIAFGSCVLSPASLIWGSIASKEPDLLLMLGDNIYLRDGMYEDGTEMLKLYGALMKFDSFKPFLDSRKVFAIWDDHDFGPNNADSSHPGKRVALDIFRRVWRNPNPPDELPDSIAFKLIRKDVDILMTDGRSYRRNPGKGGTPTMFGTRQLEWLRSQIVNSKARAIVFASGTQLFTSRSDSESLNAYPQDREILMKAFADAPAGVVILSGDRHFAELLEGKSGKRTIFEATSSPLSASLRPAFQVGADANRRGVYIGRNNFGLLTLSIGQSVTANIEIFDEKGRLLMGLNEVNVK